MESRAWLRRLYLQELVAPALILAALLAAHIARVPFAVASPARGVYRAFMQGLGLVWWWTPIALVVLHRLGRLARPETDPTRLRVLAPFVRLMLGFAAVAIVYSNLKAVLPLVNPSFVDDELLRVDTVLGLGRSLNERLGAIHASWFVDLMDWAYLSFFFYFPISMGLALLSADVEMLEEVIQGFAIIFGIGLVGYYLLPSLGTIYTHPQWHAGARGTTVWRVRDSLLTQQLQIVEGRSGPIHAFFGIAAFPSLHIAHALLALTIIGRRFRWILLGGVPAFALMLVSTVYFGWHYVVDHIGAAVVAWAAYRAVRWDRRRRVPPAAAKPRPG